jgi:hypothetical protein
MKLKLEIALQKELSTKIFSGLASLLAEFKHSWSAQEHPKSGE